MLKNLPTFKPTSSVSLKTNLFAGVCVAAATGTIYLANKSMFLSMVAGIGLAGIHPLLAIGIMAAVVMILLTLAQKLMDVREDRRNNP